MKNAPESKLRGISISQFETKDSVLRLNHVHAATTDCGVRITALASDNVVSQTTVEGVSGCSAE